MIFKFLLVLMFSVVLLLLMRVSELNGELKLVQDEFSDTVKHHELAIIMETHSMEAIPIPVPEIPSH
jgi:predicted Holliday junction resolvase-like endonuclease